MTLIGVKKRITINQGLLCMHTLLWKYFSKFYCQIPAKTDTFFKFLIAKSMQIGHKIDFLFVSPSSNIQAPLTLWFFFTILRMQICNEY